jgi:NADH-quinone oxidoreductase subunit H
MLPSVDSTTPRLARALSATLLVLLTPALALAQSEPAAEDEPEASIFVKSVYPDKWDEGSTVEIYGAGFLPPEAGTNRVCLVGELRGPKEEPVPTFEADEEGEPGESLICADAVYSASNRLLLHLDEKFVRTVSEAVATGLDEEADDAFTFGIVQRTFTGLVRVESTPTGSKEALVADYPSSNGALYRITLFPVNAKKAWMGLVRYTQTEAAKRWLEEEAGITLVPGTLEVANVKTGSRAAKAGVRGQRKNPRAAEARAEGDTLLKVDDRQVGSLRELGEALAASKGSARLFFKGVREVEGSQKRVEIGASYNLLGYHEPPPPSVLAMIVLLLVGTAVLLLWVAPFAGIITVIERKIGARMQSRVGPNRVGPQGFLQWLADGIKVMQKEDLIPDGADPILFRLAPYLMFMGMFGTFVVIPFSQWLVPADLNVGIIYLVAVVSLVVVALIMSGWASNSKWALLGGMRAAAQMISYEIPTGLSLLTGIVLAGSLSMQDLILAQGGAPWNWIIFRNPAAFLCFFFFFTSALAEANRPPFDLPEAESELVAGYNTEYSGFRFLAFWFCEYANYYIMSAVATAVFLGGWRIPGISPEDQAGSLNLQLVGLALFMGKALFLVQVVIWLRWTLPRMRVDQLMIMCWKYLVPLTLTCFMFSTLWVLLVSPEGFVQLITKWVLFLAGVALVLAFLWRAFYNFRVAKAELYASPFI